MTQQYDLIIQRIFQRLDQIAAQCGDDFPLYALPNQPWQISKGGSWLGGFWAGCWWLRAKLTDDAADKKQAQIICARLADKIDIDSINRSFIFVYGARLGAEYFNDPAAQQLSQQAAASFAASFDPVLRGFPVGTAMGGGADGKQKLSIDSLAAVIQLLGDDYAALARQHTDTLLTVCFDSSGAWHSEAVFHDGQFHAEGIAGDWSRGQAWGMLGLSIAAARWGEPYVSHAQTACHYWLQSRPQQPPVNRLSQFDGLQDGSATVIAALALRHLAQAAVNSPYWQAQAQQHLSALLHSEYFEPTGAFFGCCYAIGRNELAVVESSWGYFLLLTLILMA